MAVSASVFPVLPGKTEAYKQFGQELTRHSGYADSRRRLGIHAERSFLQSTPQGDLAIIYFEADDVARVFQGVATSQEPFDRWFREQVLDIHGVDVTQPPPGPPPHVIFDSHGKGLS